MNNQIEFKDTHINRLATQKLRYSYLIQLKMRIFVFFIPNYIIFKNVQINNSSIAQLQSKIVF